MTKSADLHIHTNYSDSSASPEEVVSEAQEKGLDCIAITDHDTFDGFLPALEKAKENHIEIIQGIELSSEVQKKDVHILGYFFNPPGEKIVEQIVQYQHIRLERVKKIIKKLKEQGVDNIEFDEVCALAKSNAVGRAHIAVLLINKGWVSNIYQVFDKYLGEHCPAYVPKYKQTPYEAIKLIKESGGVAVLAHPMVTLRDELIPGFVEAGLSGIEVYYPNCSSQTIAFYEGIAKKHNLVKTGGSDAHGAVKSATNIGKIRIPYSNVEDLKRR